MRTCACHTRPALAVSSDWPMPMRPTWSVPDSLALAVVDRLEQTFSDNFVLIVTSDHHLRSNYWCENEPYASHDCDLPEAMRSAGVPFIIASRGAVATHAVPRTNADLLPITAELSRMSGR